MNPKFKMHIPRIDDYLWVAEDGVKMQGMLDLFFRNFELQLIINC